MNTQQSSLKLFRIDLSPADYVHVPQAPKIERRSIFARSEENEWEMTGVVGVNDAGECVGISNHTWSHLDAPRHLLADGASFDEIDPRRYLASRTRIVDLTQSDAARRETIDGVDYHSLIDVDDLPGDVEGYDALIFVTGFGRLIDRGYPMTPNADEHYPNVTQRAAERLAATRSLRLLGIDSPSFDKPETNAIAHRILLGRPVEPILLLETLTCERLRNAFASLPHEALLTVEPLRAFGGARPDGALSSVYLYAAPDADQLRFDAFVSSMCEAKLV